MNLYLLTFSNGKQYVGISTKPAEKRFQEHRSAAKRDRDLPIYKAWRKLGEPTLQTLATFDTIEALLAAETVEVAARGSKLPGGYNVTDGGERSPMHCPEVAAKVSKAKTGKKRGRVHTPESREKIAAAMRGRTLSEETRRKVSEARKGVPSPLRGRKLSAEQVAGMRERNLGRVVSEETRAKIAATLAGRKPSPENLAKRAATRAATRAERERGPNS